MQVQPHTIFGVFTELYGGLHRYETASARISSATSACHEKGATDVSVAAIHFMEMSP